MSEHRSCIQYVVANPPSSLQNYKNSADTSQLQADSFVVYCIRQPLLISKVHYYSLAITIFSSLLLYQQQVATELTSKTKFCVESVLTLVTCYLEMMTSLTKFRTKTVLPIRLTDGVLKIGNGYSIASRGFRFLSV